jgi:sortase A
MRTGKSLFRWLFLLGGAFFLFEGGSSVYPLLVEYTESPWKSHDPSWASDYQPAAYPDSPVQGAYMFRLSLPRLNKTLSVVEGTTKTALRKGPGHLEGTAWPGHPGNSVIAGHRDTHFRVLKDVKIGDEIWIERGTELYGYRVTETMIVEPEDTSSILPTDEAVLTLVTCYPFFFLGPAPDRFIVRAEAI